MKKLLLASLAFTVTAFAPARADDRPVLIVVGMASEADIARGDETSGTIVVGAMNENALRAHLASLDPRKFRAVISFGVAGGLDRKLPVGTLVIPEQIVAEGHHLLASHALNQRTRQTLTAAGLHFSTENIAGVDELAEGTDAQRLALQKASGSGAVDMESHIAAEFAAHANLPFIAIRALSDTYGDILPPAARLQLGENGEVQMGSVLGSILSNPGQISDLVKTGQHFKAAKVTLEKARAALPELFR
ncbi:MAG: phosphorylase family protein [Bdellovibrionota bacterium]